MRAMVKAGASAALCAAVLAAAPASAAVVINVIEGPTGITVTGSGSLDLTGLVRFGIGGNAGINPLGANVIVGPSGGPGDLYGKSGGIPGPFFFSLTNVFLPFSSASGSLFGVSRDLGTGPFWVVPSGYVSGSALSGQGFIAGKTLADLGVSPGSSFKWTGPQDTLTVNFGVVPEPSSWMMMILGFGLVAQALRRRHRAAHAAAV